MVGTPVEDKVKIVKAYIEYPSGKKETVGMRYKDKKKVELNGEKELFLFEGSFLSSELGLHSVLMEVESKDGVKNTKRDSIDIGLSRENIEEFKNSGGNLRYLEKLWLAYLLDSRLKIDREEAIMENFKILMETGVMNGNEESITYMKELTSHVFGEGRRNLIKIYDKETLRNVLNTINSQPIVITGLVGTRIEKKL
ncbi:MAG: hypothetical protein NZ870_04205 [bacterium]|nr:hypothetical protein [bacterium]